MPKKGPNTAPSCDQGLFPTIRWLAGHRPHNGHGRGHFLPHFETSYPIKTLFCGKISVTPKPFHEKYGEREEVTSQLMTLGKTPFSQVMKVSILHGTSCW